jgi:hypothetical protein
VKKPASKGTQKKKTVEKKPASKGTQKKKTVEKKPEVKKPEVKKTVEKKAEVKATTTPVVSKTTVAPVPKVVQAADPQTQSLPSVPPSQVVDVKAVEKAAKNTNKKIVKQAEALETTNSTAAKQILTAKDGLKKAVDKSFGSIQMAFKTSAKETKKLAESIKKTTTPIKAKKTPSGKKVLKIAVITDKDAQTLVSNPGGGTAAAAMTNQKNIINASS